MLKLLWNDTDPVTVSTLTYGSVAIVAFSLSTLTNGILQGIDRMKVPVIHAVISLIAHIGVFYLMLDFFHEKVFAVVFANLFFALLMCVLNAMALKKYAGYKQEYYKTFLVPFLASAIMGGAVYLLYHVLSAPAGNTIACLLSILAGVLIYGFALILLKGIGKEELTALPMGGKIYRILNKMHLM